MNTNDPTSGRILVHGHGSGGITRGDIERRARELATIDGRSGAQPTEDDLARAQAELLGLNLPATTMEDEEARAAVSRDPSEPASIRGREAVTQEGPDEEKAVERMALEGVEEAQHEQMLAARRRERRAERADEI